MKHPLFHAQNTTATIHVIIPTRVYFWLKSNLRQVLGSHRCPKEPQEFQDKAVTRQFLMYIVKIHPVFQEFRLGSAFFGKVANFEPWYLRHFWVKIQSFCADLKFPEFFKTHPTFVHSSLFKASRSLWTLTSIFFGTPCILCVYVPTQIITNICAK